MNRYALFCGTYNLMMGGIKDFQESAETLEEAKEKAAQIAKEELFKYWVQIFDKETDQFTTYSIIDGQLKERDDE
ncbi:hypothetical protein P3339_09395 [Microbulbifer sp. MLAF003]|uniref:hypothetical protein n=1 Tax=Microbulbifer sp. MLAF003 TaxID=3032582 RepID=UPI0024ACB972|nr:hypothetical protein [Microbulbifer sp. MLAF003]WHI52955.1 hypothetical protein P3339_09395 [Microbulbifer sp. MLAF003]